MKPRAFTLIELLFVVATIAILAAISVPNFLEAQTRAKISRTAQDMAVTEAALRAYYGDHLRYPPNTPAVRAWLIDAQQRNRPSLTNYSSDEFLHDIWMSDPFGDTEQTFQESQPPAEAKAAIRDAFPKLNPEEQARFDWVSERINFRQGHWGPWDGAGRPTPKHKSPQLDDDFYLLSRLDLSALTTPVAYLSGELALDTFGNTRFLSLVYLNLHDVAEATDSRYLPPGEPRYLILSNGPGVADPGPMPRWRNEAGEQTSIAVRYDPTNGTVTRGFIYRTGTNEAIVGSK